MKKWLDQSLEEGAFGMTTGLEYHPGKMAVHDEITELCRSVAKVDGLYSTHSRNRDKRYFTGFGEALDVARDAGVRLQISHINPKYAFSVVVEHGGSGSKSAAPIAKDLCRELELLQI